MERIIPTYDNGEWTTTSFEEEEFKQFLVGLFKEPGKYNFDETSFKFNQEARNFNDTGVYCDKPFRSKDFILSSSSSRLIAQL